MANQKHIAQLEKEWFNNGPQLSEVTANNLKRLLALLRAMHWNYWTSHWISQGGGFYGDHLLFQRFYEGMPAEIDGLAEKVVSYVGPEAVSMTQQIGLAQQYISAWAAEDLFSRGLQSENQLQDLLKNTMAQMEEVGESTLGLDDFLPALASAHETNIYLLQQRLRGTVKKNI